MTTQPTDFNTENPSDERENEGGGSLGALSR